MTLFTSVLILILCKTSVEFIFDFFYRYIWFSDVNEALKLNSNGPWFRFDTPEDQSSCGCLVQSTDKVPSYGRSENTDACLVADLRCRRFISPHIVTYHGLVRKKKEKDLRMARDIFKEARKRKRLHLRMII